MSILRVRIVLGLFVLQLLLLTLGFSRSFWGKQQASYSGKKALAQRFLLSDYCLSTESRHTRHYSSPEILAPFQDIPGYLDHFPSSSFYPVPDSLIQTQ